jgi:hypothetical protein
MKSTGDNEYSIIIQKPEKKYVKTRAHVYGYIL